MRGLRARIGATGSSRAVAPADVKFDNLFYADVALQSYAVFADLKRQGKIPAHCKFQVDLVPRTR